MTLTLMTPYMTILQTGRVSDSVTRCIGAANVGLRYLATLNKLTRPTRLVATAEGLVPRAAAIVLRRAPVVVQRKTTHTNSHFLLI